MIRVVSGLATLDGRILMGRRGPKKLRGGLWETPGGKVDPGETPEHALEREWREEVGIVVNAGPLIAVASFDLEIDFVVELYRVDASRAVFESAKPLDHTDLEWIMPRDAVKFFACMPAFYVNYPQIRSYMRSIYGPQGTYV